MCIRDSHIGRELLLCGQPLAQGIEGSQQLLVRFAEGDVYKRQVFPCRFSIARCKCPASITKVMTLGLACEKAQGKWDLSLIHI